MKASFLLYVICSFYALSSFSQNMQKGFDYLETGNFKQAKTFFEKILKEYPSNKTAKICYGRAVGLNGNPKKSTLLFTELLNDYPLDFEIKLNYAESLLWNKKYTSAKNYYQKLLHKNKNNFPTLLGYANTLSNLKEYENAIIYINKALKVSPKNKNALLSKKYIRLGLANKKMTALQYSDAEKILANNLLDFKNDTETLLNLANVYIASKKLNKATQIYEIIGKTSENKVLSLNGISLVYHLKNKNKKALITSQKAISLLYNKKSISIINQTKKRYIETLIWNKKYALAEEEINRLILKNKTPENWILALRANLNTYKSNFKKSLRDYNLILKKDSSSFNGNLGKANILKAYGDYNGAYKNAEKTLTFYNKQQDAIRLINNLNNIFTPFIKTEASYSFDNDDNDAYSYKASSEFPITTKLKLLANYNYRTTDNNRNNDNATANIFLAGIAYQLLNNLTINASLGTTFVATKTNKYNQLLTDISLDLKPFKLQNLKLGYKREMQNFNTDLLNKEIVQNHFFINYNLSTNFDLGWYTQYYYTSQSDANSRNLLFTSLYYNLSEKPFLKAGFNYQNISFKNQVPNIYFSPKKFNAVEVFFNIIKDEMITKNNQLFYELTAATGFQYIEETKKQSTYRMQGKIGYKLHNNSLLNIYGIHSNIASTTAAGFTYTEIGLRFKWYLFEKPLFRK